MYIDDRALTFSELLSDVNGINDEGNTALILSTICMSESAADCAKLLIESKADPEIENLPSENGGGGGCRALHYASGEGNMPIVKYLVEGAKVELRAVSKDVLTPLLCAMINNRSDVASFLIRSDPGLLEITDSNGDYPLHLCVLENLLDMMVTLLREGADPLMVNTRGETPLVVAMDIQAEPEMTQILEQAEQEAEAQRVELQATELEAEAEAVLEHGDAKTAKQKLLAAAELYRQISAQEEAEACMQKAKALPQSAASTPSSTPKSQSAPGKSLKLSSQTGAQTTAVCAEEPPAPLSSSTSFSKLKKRLLGSEPAPGAAAAAATRAPPAYLSALPGMHEDDDDDDALSAASDKQVLHAVERLAKRDEDSAKARLLASGGGSLIRGALPASRKDVDGNGRTGTWVGDVFYSDDEEDGDEVSPSASPRLKREISSPRSPPPPPQPYGGLRGAPAGKHGKEEEEEEEEFEEEVSQDAEEESFDKNNQWPVQHVAGTGGGEGTGEGSMRQGGLLRQLQVCVGVCVYVCVCLCWCLCLCLTCATCVYPSLAATVSLLLNPGP